MTHPAKPAQVNQTTQDQQLIASQKARLNESEVTIKTLKTEIAQLTESAKAVSEQESRQMAELRAKIEVLETDQKTREKITSNLQSFLDYKKIHVTNLEQESKQLVANSKEVKAEMEAAQANEKNLNKKLEDTLSEKKDIEKKLILSENNIRDLQKKYKGLAETLDGRNAVIAKINAHLSKVLAGLHANPSSTAKAKPLENRTSLKNTSADKKTKPDNSKPK